MMSFHEVPAAALLFPKVHSSEKEHIMSATCEVVLNSRKLGNKISVNLSLMLVMAPPPEKVRKVPCSRFLPTPTHPVLPALCPDALFSQPKNSPLCQRKEDCWILFPNISIINQSFNKIQWSLQNFPLNRLPLRIEKVLGAKFQVASHRF